MTKVIDNMLAYLCIIGIFVLCLIGSGVVKL